jgi:hypothetical protein
VSGDVPSSGLKIEERVYVVEGFEEKKAEKIVTICVEEKVAANAKQEIKKPLSSSDEKVLNFICAEHKREEYRKYAKQIDLEKEVIIIKSIDFLRKKGGRNFRNNKSILLNFTKKIEDYVNFKQISQKMKTKTKQIMLYNMSYIALQLENIKEGSYIYYKIGEILFKYYDINKLHIKQLIEKNKTKIADIKKITKKE